MINLTLNIIFKKNGNDLADTVRDAIEDTRRILFNKYSNGIPVPPNEIVSTTKKIPPTYTLGFCKCFFKNSIDKVNLSPESFVEECYKVWTESKGSISKEIFKEVIPSYIEAESKLSATILGGINRGIGIMLFSLWSRDAIVMTPYYVLPGTHENKNGTKIRTILCEPLYTEVISFYQSYRQHVIKKDSAKIQAGNGLSKSLQNNLQSYAWRMIVATDWHIIEQVNIDEAINFLDKMNGHRKGDKSFITIPVPVKEMINLLKNNHKDRARFTLDDFLKKRNCKIKSKAKDSSYSRTFLANNFTVADFPSIDLKSKSSLWIETQTQFIDLKRARGTKSIKSFDKAFTVLNEYLFYWIPKHAKDNNLTVEIPESPSSFNRHHIDGNKTTPSFLDYVSASEVTNGKRTPQSVYGILNKIEQYFDFIESLASTNKSFNSFKNPILRKLDYPIVRRREGTEKKIVSQLHFPCLLNYLYAVESFMWYITVSMIRNGENINAITNTIENIPHAENYPVKTEDFGYIPFIYHKGKVIPIETIPKNIFSFSTRQLGENKIKTPNIIHLHQTIVAFETGIRNLHIKWLDSRTYDQHIDRRVGLHPICILEVSTDKVKEKPWLAYVSRRVIEILDKLKFLRTAYDEPWVNESYWYDGHEHSKFGKLVPLFSHGGDSKNSGLPPSDGTSIIAFKRTLFSFQSFSNDNSLFDNKISWVTTLMSERTSDRIRTYKSEITPHSCRATVVSQNIKMLPPHIIGKYITGHESAQVVAYYSVIDPVYMDNIAKGQNLAVNGSQPLFNDNYDPVAIVAEDIHSSLRKAIDIKPEDAFSDFGATSFEREKSNGDLESGITIAKSVNTDQLAHNSTHICPYNNVCPDDVALEVGKMNCGQCWASIKTVDHLPRIAAHIRDIHAQVAEATESIRHMISQEVNDAVLEKHEQNRNRLAAEESAWISTQAILEEFRKTAVKRNDFLVGRPEIIELHIQSIATPESPLTNVLLRIQDAKDYPEYLTPQLKSAVTKLRNKILAQTGDIDLLINQPDDYELIDQFRGIIRGICEASNVSTEEISKAMNRKLDKCPTLLLEAL